VVVAIKLDLNLQAKVGDPFMDIQACTRFLMMAVFARYDLTRF